MLSDSHGLLVISVLLLLTELGGCQENPRLRPKRSLLSHEEGEPLLSWIASTGHMDADGLTLLSLLPFTQLNGETPCGDK
jgi:hypothetical protein